MKFTKSHEWIKEVSESKVLVGLTNYAQEQLGDLVFVNFPEVNDNFKVKDTFADVESVKAVSDVYSPVSGTITKVNDELLDNPEKINENPNEAWLVEFSNITEYDELLSEDEYLAYIESLD